MRNQLKEVERNLRYIAKRNKNITFSVGLALLYLMLGINAFSEEVNAVENKVGVVSKQEIRASTDRLSEVLRQIKEENDKKLEGAQLELIQLMEQGDQVVKSPWSSWQFGIGYSYNHWNGRYSGRGDKEREVLKAFKGETLLSKYIKTDVRSTIYGATELDLENVYEPNAEITVSASVKVKNINKRTPNISLQTISSPSSPQLNIALPSPEAITKPVINSPVINRKVIEPDVNFFHEFLHSYYGPVGWNNEKVYKEKDGKKYFIVQSYTDVEGIFWSGVDASNDSIADKDKEVKTVSGAKNVKIEGTPQADFSDNVRRANIIGIRNPTHSDSINPTRKITGKKIVFYIAGGEKLHGATNIYGPSHEPREGGAGIYIEGDGEFSDMTFNLYGKAAAINILGIGGPRVILNNSQINTYKDYNTVFNLTGADIVLESKNFYGRRFAGISSYIKGNVDINLKTKNNLVYGLANYMSTYKFINSGKIKLDGASNNIFFIGAYSPNPTKYLTDNTTYGDTNNIPIKHKKETDINAFIPLVQTDNYIEQYGDENVVLIFNKSRIGEGDLIKKHAPIAIYQGEIDIKAKIGEHLSSAGDTKQTENGNLIAKGYSDKFVDSNVGVYANSGQRKGLKPHEHLGANTYHNLDEIHNLEIGKFDIRFGKYSKQGFMFLSKLGTVIDVGKSTTTAHIGSISTSFTDGLNGADTDDRKAGLETVIAYSEGVFANNAFKLGVTTGLEGKASEIIVHIPLTMTSREGIAYFGENKGKVTVNANTEATGRKSVIAYANKGGEVNITGSVSAKDRGVLATDAIIEKYKNIGAYAKSENGENTLITINGNIDLNGIGALADGQGSKIYLKGNTNNIHTGTDGALVAKNGGEIEFHGGTIVNKNNNTERGLTDNDHKNTTPFYAENNGKIIFKNGTTTNIEMYDGVLVFGEDSDYTIGTGGVNKYQGMVNINVKLMKDGVNLGVFKGLKGSKNITWAGNSNLITFTNGLLAIPKFGTLDPNGKSFKTTLIEGTLTVDSNINLSDSSDNFNNILMERELVTINSGKTVTGNAKGLSMGSNSGAASNAESGYINKGVVNITGGTLTSGVAGINVSYGNVLNEGNVKVDNGAGIYGTNGSKLENKGDILLTGIGQGIVGISKATGIGAPTYGKNSVEIINKGNITIAGINSTGIYAENNSNAPQNDISIKNSNKIKIGDNGVGIALKSTISSTVGGVITINGTGNSDITVGKNGVGIYAENTTITLTSDYGIETKDNGVGIYTTGNSSVGANKTLEYKYTGSSTGNGIAMLYSGSNAMNNLHIKLNNSTNGTGGIIGIYAKGGGNFKNTANIIGTSNTSEFGIVAENTNVNNSGNINFLDALNLTKGNVGILAKNSLSAITNTGNITIGNNGVGLYGYEINHTAGDIKVGDNGIAVYSQGGNISLVNGSIKIGEKEAVGVFTRGTGQSILSTNTMLIGQSSYGFVMKGKNYNLQMHNPDVTLKGDSVFAYSDVEGTIENKTKLNSVGDKNYGLYSAGTVRNLADIDFRTGKGNVGVYSISYTNLSGVEIAGKASNGTIGLPLSLQPKITVSESDISNKLYGIGMAAGYINEITGVVERIGQIENFGIIDVFTENSIGMYAVGSGSKAINRGFINLSGKKTVGMYLDQNAIGENYGTIKTVPNPTNDGIIGVVALNGAILKNYGQIIIDSPNGIGFYSASNGKYEDHGGIITVSGLNSKEQETASRNDTGKEVKGIKIVAPPGTINATVIREGQVVSTTSIDTNIPLANATQVQVGETTLDLSVIKIPSVNLGQASSLGMYIDTSGVNYTNPIQGLHHLSGLKQVNLMIGSEASLYTNAKDIEIGQNILKPYNDTITNVSSSGSGNVKWIINSSNLTWIATVTQNPDFTISKMYLSKIPYTSFAKDKDTYNFMQGIEEYYSKATGNDKEIFNKINSLGKQEAQVFAQAVDEMMGHQYANVQQRIHSTGQILDKEFDYLKDEWRTASKDSNKIKVFGTKGEYSTDTAGIIDYKSNAYGVAYVGENETMKLGVSSGWYTGIVHNTFKFKDIGNSKEEMLQAKLGLYNTKAFDDNGSLAWTISGEGFVGYNKMHRKFLVVDEIFNTKSNYWSYGVVLKNELSKSFRLSEDFTLRGYGSIKAEYGRFQKIKEKKGEVRLEVKANDYISIKLELGAELIYKVPLTAKLLNIKLGVAYENELGKVGDANNKARVAYTNADWFGIRGEKEDRRGNVKADLSLGLENERIGVSTNIGYDTKGKNLRGGLGIRVIF